MERVVEDATSGTRFLALLLTLFGVLAVALAVAGVYGVTTFQASRRTHEIGVRAAMGATRPAILRMVLASTMRQALAGIAVGLCCVLGLNRIIRNYMISEGAVDGATYLQVTIAIAAITALAGLIPAWRASRIQPAAALREE